MSTSVPVQATQVTFPNQFTSMAGSQPNPVNTYQTRFHGDNTGSNPVGDANNPSSLFIVSNMLKREVLEQFEIPCSFEYIKPFSKRRF
jgi:hypothetical protein